MIRFLLVLLAFVSALLAFIFQETMLFVASGGLLMVSVVLVLLQVREQVKRKNRLKLPNELTPEDELRARGVLEIRPRAKAAKSAAAYAPPEVKASAHSEAELQMHGILEVREKRPVAGVPPADEAEAPPAPLPVEEVETDAGIPWSVVAADQEEVPLSLFSEVVETPETDPDEELVPEPSLESELMELADRQPIAAELEAEEIESPQLEETPEAEVLDLEEQPVDLEEESAIDETPVAMEESPLVEAADEAIEEMAEQQDVTPVVEPSPPARRPISRRRVEVDAHLPALQISLGAHTICLIDVDTDTCVYRLRSIVSSGPVDHAGTEYPFAGFFLSDLLAETTVLDIGSTGLTLPDLRFYRDPVALKQVIAAPVMKGGLPAAFLVAGFENQVDKSSEQAVTKAAAFFSSLYTLQEDHPSRGDSPLTRAKRKPPSLRLVKSNPKSSQSKIIAEEMTRARGTSHPMAFALVCLDKGDEISHSDEMTLYQVEEWMRKCLEQITPDGRIEYLGELGYGIIQLRDVSDVEGWVRRAQQIFRSEHGPVDAHPIVGVAMLSEGHRDPEDLQADAVRALRAAYETGDSTILVG
ncbi:MAG: hypothetical protein WBW88_16695 [Rhodothermales bacterium]